MMRWPFVYRGRYEAVLIDRDNQRTFYETAHAHIEQHRRDYQELLAKYHELRLAGGAAPIAPASLERREVDPLTAAISAKAGSDRRLHDLMTREAQRAKQLGIPPEDIILQIERGIVPDESLFTTDIS